MTALSLASVLAEPARRRPEAQALAHHKYPRVIQVVPELPLGPSNKVLKRELRRQFGG